LRPSIIFPNIYTQTDHESIPQKIPAVQSEQRGFSHS
jgi:hypothetical protein